MFTIEVLAVMKRFTMDEVIARRKDDITEPCREHVGNMSETCRKRDLSSLQKLGIIRHEGKKNTGVWVIIERPH